MPPWMAHPRCRAAQPGRWPLGVGPVHQPLRQAQRLQRQLHHLKGGPGAALQGLLHGLRPGGLLLVGALGHSEHGRHGVEGLRVPLHHVQEPVLQVPGLFQGLPCPGHRIRRTSFCPRSKTPPWRSGLRQGPGQCPRQTRRREPVRRSPAGPQSPVPSVQKAA